MKLADRNTVMLSALTYAGLTSALFVALSVMGFLPQDGVDGRPGRDGVDGSNGELKIYVVEEDITLSYSNGFLDVVYCDAGDLAVSGGYWSLTNLRMHISGPAVGFNGGTDPIGWRVGVRRTEINQISSDVRIYAVCNDLEPLRP